MRFTRLQVRVDLAALLLILLTAPGCEGVDTSISTKGVSLSSTIAQESDIDPRTPCEKRCGERRDRCLSLCESSVPALNCGEICWDPFDLCLDMCRGNPWKSSATEPTLPARNMPSSTSAHSSADSSLMNSDACWFRYKWNWFWGGYDFIYPITPNNPICRSSSVPGVGCARCNYDGDEFDCRGCR